MASILGEVSPGIGVEIGGCVAGTDLSSEQSNTALTTRHVIAIYLRVIMCDTMPGVLADNY